MRYQATMIVPHGKDSRQAGSIAATVTVVDPAWMSIEMAPTQMIQGMTMICDLKDGKAFSLIPNAKMAVRMNRQNQPKEFGADQHPGKAAQHGAEAGRNIGEEEIGGHRAGNIRCRRREQRRRGYENLDRRADAFAGADGDRGADGERGEVSICVE